MALIDYIVNLWTALDQSVNALLFGNPKETVSYRAARAAKEGRTWGCVLCRLLDVVDNGHCRRFGPD